MSETATETAVEKDEVVGITTSEFKAEEKPRIEEVETRVIENNSEEPKQPEAATQKETVATLTPEEERAKHIENFFSEKTEGKFKNLEEYTNHIKEQAKSEIKVPKLSERLQKLAELEERGIDIERVLDYQKKGYDKLNPENISDAKKLFFEKWREEDSDITDRELEHKFKKQYEAVLKNSDDLTDDEREEQEIAKIALTRNAKKIHKEFIDKQKELELPKSNPDYQAELESLKRQWQEATEPHIKSYNEETFKVAEGEAIKFSINDSQKAKLQEAIIDPSTYILNKCAVKTADGKIVTDIPKLRRILALVENENEIIGTAFAQGKSAGAKAEVERIENLERGSGVASPEVDATTGENSYAQYIRQRNGLS